MLRNDFFRLVGNSGLVDEVGCAKFGQQALGITPGGAADQLSFQQVYILLGEPEHYASCEIIFPPTGLYFTQAAIFCLGGASFAEVVLLRSGAAITLAAYCVYQAECGDQLKLAGKRSGARSYLLACSVSQASYSRLCLQRSAYANWFPHYSNLLDVIAGPEFSSLADPAQFLSSAWQISPQSNAMGIRLVGASRVELLQQEIISSPLVTGTIQFTRSGPIVLLNKRQTIGGYPRCVVLTPRAICHLAQINLNCWVRFRLVSRSTALAELEREQQALARFRQHYL